MDHSNLSSEEYELIIELQSSDAESSSEDDVTSLANKHIPHTSIGTASVWKSVVNTVNWIEGIGFLALPYAVKERGIAVILAFFIIPVCFWYTGKILIECLYDTDKKQRRLKVRSTFKELGEIRLPKYGGYIVTAIMHLDVYILSVSYLILFGSLMSHALPPVPLTVTAWTCIAGVVVLPTTFLRSLSEIAWLSVVGVIALISVLISVLWHGADHSHRWNLDTILFWDSEGFSITLPILISSYSAIPLLPSVEESMREKHKFSRTLALSYVITTLIKITFSLFAFLSLESNTDPAGPFRINISFIFVLFCILSYALPFHSVSLLLQSTKMISNFISTMPILCSVFISNIVVLSTVLVAILLPKFALVVSFTGSICA